MVEGWCHGGGAGVMVEGLVSWWRGWCHGGGTGIMVEGLVSWWGAGVMVGGWCHGGRAGVMVGGWCHGGGAGVMVEGLVSWWRGWRHGGGTGVSCQPRIQYSLINVKFLLIVTARERYTPPPTIHLFPMGGGSYFAMNCVV